MSQICSQHLVIKDFQVSNDCLCVGGLELPRLAKRVGKTPFYAYDRAKITERVEQLRQKLPSGIGLHYAMKANPMPAVVNHLSQRVDGVDVASLGELKIALDCGVHSESISFAGPGKAPAELEAAVAANIMISLESETELERVVVIGERLGVRPRVAVRINPDFELKASGMKMSGGPKQFGIDAERVPQVLSQMQGMPLDFKGFHTYSGSQNLSAEAIVRSQQQTLELALELAEFAPAPITYLNIGGGFGIPYFPGDKALDLDPIAENLAQWMRRLESELPHAQVVLELGRYLVGEAGIYVAEVIDRKVSRGQVFLVTNGGLHHHLAASGNFGQIIRKNYPVTVGNRVFGASREIATVVGPLCTPLDLLADRMELARADIGDLIVVFQSGAYGLSASPGEFLGHPAPAEVLV